MTRTLVAAAAALLVMLALDALWLGVLALDLYRTQIGALMLDQPRFGVAALFYLFYIAGVVLFAVLPALEAGRWTRAAALGAALGFIAYMTYDLTNLATLRGWSTIVVLADLAWGVFITAVTASAGYAAASRVGR